MKRFCNRFLPRHLFYAILFTIFICELDHGKAHSAENHRHIEPNKITLCTRDGEKHTLETSSCKKGAWIPDALDVTCACVSGLWAVSENFCDRNFLLLVGDNQECFEVSKYVRRIVSLYNPNDPKEKGKHLVIRSNLEKFESFDHSLHTRDNEDGSFIIRFNATKRDAYLKHTEGYQEKFWQRCVKASKKPNIFQIIKADGVTYIDDKKGCRKNQDLEFPMKKLTKAIWGVSLGQSWNAISGVGRKSYECYSTCLENNGRRHRQVLNRDYPEDEEIKTETLYAEVIGTSRKLLSNPNATERAGADSSEELLDPSQERYQKIDRDTSKIAYYFKNWNMKKEPGPKLPYKEYKYLQYARVILLKTCPTDYVPVGALTDFLRLFRYLIYESLRKSPEHYSEDINKAAHKRIIASLESCYTSAERMEFSLGSSCPQTVQSIAYKGKTLTISDSSLLPSHLLSNANRTDLVLETIWKMILHTHYLCSENFVKNGGDLSTMYVKLQEFLTDPHIMFRWENPGYATNQVYHILFPSLDFVKFVDGINACLAGAQGFSKYTHWLKRPSSKEQKTSTIMARSLTKTSVRGRSLNSLPTLFNNKGYCTHAYDDPLRWSRFNKDVKAFCNPSL